MGVCNYCGYMRLKDRAANSGMLVTSLPTSFGLGGVDVFVHPPDVKIDVLAVDEKASSSSIVLESLVYGAV